MLAFTLSFYSIHPACIAASPRVVHMQIDHISAEEIAMDLVLELAPIDDVSLDDHVVSIVGSHREQTNSHRLGNDIDCIESSGCGFTGKYRADSAIR